MTVHVQVTQTDRGDYQVRVLINGGYATAFYAGYDEDEAWTAGFVEADEQARSYRAKQRDLDAAAL